MPRPVRLLAIAAAWSALIAIAIAIAAPVAALAQEPDTDTDTWQGLDTLDPEDYDFQSDLIGTYSHGWFPKANPGRALTFSLAGVGDVFDIARDVRPYAFVPTTAPFSHSNPFDGDERTILQANNEEESEDGYPVTSYAEYQFRYTHNLPMPLVLRAEAGLKITDGLLFSHDTTRSYLGLNGVPQPLKEVGVAHLKEYQITGALGVNIPVYGVFLEAEETSIASYYYLHGGMSASYALSSRLTQYAQIANAKNDLRYGNGIDTVTLLNRVRPANLNRLRTAVDVGIGWNFAVEFFTFSFEAFGSIPLDPVLTDADWRQYEAGLRLSFGYQWLPKRKGS